MVRRLGVVAAVATLGLAGCGNAASDSTAHAASRSTTASAVSPPTPNATYADAVSLRDAAVAAGYSCPHWKTKPSAVLSASKGQCSPLDGFATFHSHKDVRSALRMLVLPGDTPKGVLTQYYLVGPNWIIANFERRQLTRLTRDLGGDIVHA